MELDVIKLTVSFHNEIHISTMLRVLWKSGFCLSYLGILLRENLTVSIK